MQAALSSIVMSSLGCCSASAWQARRRESEYDQEIARACVANVHAIQQRLECRRVNAPATQQRLKNAFAIQPWLERRRLNACAIQQRLERRLSASVFVLRRDCVTSLCFANAFESATRNGNAAESRRGPPSRKDSLSSTQLKSTQLKSAHFS